MTPTPTDILRDAIEIARWAPSSHNAQPWKIVRLPDIETAGLLFPHLNLDGDGEHLLLTLDSNRRLRALPSLEHEMYLSCGMFTGLMCMALQAWGIPWRMHWIYEKTGPALRDLEMKLQCRTLALLTIAAADAADLGNPTDKDRLERLRDLAYKRKTHRGPFAARQLDEGSVTALSTSSWPQTLTGDALHIHIEHNHSAIRGASDLVSRFAKLDFNKYRVWKETYGYIRFDPRKKAEDGFYLQCLFGPMNGLRRWYLRGMLSPAVMQALWLVSVPQRIARQLGALVAESPLLLFGYVDDEHPAAPTLVQAGARLMELWLKAQSLNMALHPISVMLQHEDARRALEHHMGVNGRLVFFSRLGAAPETGCDSPRRAAADLLVTA